MLLLCLKVFFARVIDVSLGTVRTILVVKGKRGISTCIAFIEAFIYFVVVREALNTELASLFIVIAYAGGFACGTLLGGFLSDKFIDGTLGVQVITSKKDDAMIKEIRKEGYAVSVVDVKGQDDHKEKYMLFIEINKHHVNHLREVIKRLDAKAFLVVNETKYVQNGFFK